MSANPRLPAEAPRATVDDRLPLGRTAPDPLILHEQDPAPRRRVGDPPLIIDILVLWLAIVLGQGDQRDATSTKQPRHLDPTEASVDEDERRVSHERLGSMARGNTQSVLEFVPGH